MSPPPIRVLGAAFAAAPGLSPRSAAVMCMVESLTGELDLVTVKTEDLSHVKRLGEARMFRVPMGETTLERQTEIYARALGRQIEAEHYDVVHVLDPYAGAMAAEHQSRSDFKLIYEICGLPDRGPLGEAWRRSHEQALSDADLVLVPTESLRDRFQERDVGPVAVLRPGVDVNHFDWTANRPVGSPRLLFLGPFSSMARMGDVLTAVERVADLRPVRALLAGDRSQGRRAELRSLVVARGLSKFVTVRGEPSLADLPALIGAADVCIVPEDADDEGTSPFLAQPLLEFSACYRPVVAVDAAGTSEFLRDEKEALLCHPGNPGGLGAAILEVLRDAQLRESISDGAYRRVRDEFSMGARRRQLTALYETLYPGSQWRDPWERRFDELTGPLRLPTSSIELVEEVDSAATIAPPPTALLDGDSVFPSECPPEVPGNYPSDVPDSYPGDLPSGLTRVEVHTSGGQTSELETPSANPERPTPPPAAAASPALAPMPPALASPVLPPPPPPPRALAPPTVTAPPTVAAPPPELASVPAALPVVPPENRTRALADTEAALKVPDTDPGRLS